MGESERAIRTVSRMWPARGRTASAELPAAYRRKERSGAISGEKLKTRLGAKRSGSQDPCSSAPCHMRPSCSRRSPPPLSAAGNGVVQWACNGPQWESGTPPEGGFA